MVCAVLDITGRCRRSISPGILSLKTLCEVFPVTNNTLTFLSRPSVCSPEPDFQCQWDVGELGVEPPPEQRWSWRHLLQRGVQEVRCRRPRPLPVLWQWCALQPPAERLENHQSLHYRPPGTHELHLWSLGGEWSVQAKSQPGPSGVSHCDN